MKRLKKDRRYIEKFYNAASGYIKFVAYFYLVDKSFVDDVVNSTFYKIFDNIREFDEKQSGKAWISKIAQHEAYSINDRERKHYHASLDEVNEEIACIADDSAQLEFVAALHTEIDGLDKIDGEIVRMRIIEDMTYEEIADRLNMYVGTVYKRYKRSLQKINKEIL